MKRVDYPNEFASWLTINRDCNLRCDMCYAADQWSSSQDMTLETVEKSLTFFKGLPLKRVILIGGEPTVHPDFLTIVKMVKNAGLIPALITNGIKLANDTFLANTIASGVSGITISLKGSSDDQYLALAGVKSFQKVKMAIANVSRSGVNHSVSVTVGDGLFDDFDRMIDFLLESGTSNVSLDMERPTVSSGQACSSGKTSAKAMADFFVSTYPKMISSGMDFVIKTSIPFCLFPAGFIEKLKSDHRIVSGCHIYGGSGLIIDPSGKLLPCNHFCENPLGELGVDFSIGEEYLAFRKRGDVTEFYSLISSYPHERCVQCEHWEDCGAGCRIRWLHQDAENLIPSEEGR